MYRENPGWKLRRPPDQVSLVPAADESLADLAEWDGLGSPRLWDDLWDAFERDDEMAEPQPEYGDFWGKPDGEGEI